ncbi:MAG: hypothetical protein RMY16_26060 [Nostoc sp. DedQUE12b]|nr:MULTISPECIES: hypothetical protein [unclassified Nostoc]MDZ7952456.1 hypothetical protein [Nostoc sp. DedQUE09]MDZ8088985.1 hypothetical protein [Nostoc sp. DedQUE12b]
MVNVYGCVHPAEKTLLSLEKIVLVPTRTPLAAATPNLGIADP